MSDAEKDLLVEGLDENGEEVSEVLPAEEVEEEAAPEEEAEEEAEEESAPEEPEETEPEPAPEPEEEVVEEAAPDEPDPPEEQSGPQDLEGIITELSSEAFEKLTEIWESKGSPHQFDYQGVRWAVYDEGAKFVRTGGQGGMDQFYGSLSIG